MEIKFVKHPNFACNECYVESGQSNPLRWQLHSFSEALNGYYPLVATMRCKDYFNDVAYMYTNTTSKLHKQRASVYGFEATKLPYEEMRKYKGLFILLTNLHKDFRDNIHNKLNPWLIENNGEPISLADVNQNSSLLFIPESYLKTTLYISVLTQMIRYCNDHLQDEIKNNLFYNSTTGQNLVDRDRVFNTQMQQFIKYGGFNIPAVEKYPAFTSYSKELLDGLEDNNTASILIYVHNCGYISVMNNYSISLQQGVVNAL